MRELVNMYYYYYNEIIFVSNDLEILRLVEIITVAIRDNP